MKRLLAALPLTFLFVGCAPTTDNTIESTANTAGENVSTNAAQSTADNTTDNTAEPLDMVMALERVKVPPPPKDLKVPDKARVLLETSQGPITLELNGKAAPQHVRSFLYLAKRGFYNGTRFHRHEDLLGNGQGYIIQGGDPLTKYPGLEGDYGKGGPGYQIPREHNQLKHDRLVIAAARSTDPNSAGSQFYITQDPVYFLDTARGGYTVFGKVVAGQENALKLTQGDVLKRVIVK